MKYHTRQMFRGNKFIIMSTGTEMIKKILTTRLSSTQQDLDVLKEQLSGRNGGLKNLTPSHMSKLRNIWKALNATIEKTAVPVY